jgi:DNA-binding transcriptional MerR regulator
MDQAPMASAVRAQPRLRASADTAETAHRADTAGRADRADRADGFPAMPSDLSGHRFDDEDYPAYSMGRAAEILGVTPAFLRTLGAAKLIAPQRSEGGHRRYSRYQLRLAARARELVDQGTALEAACRIIILEDQLAEALRINTELQQNRDRRQPGNTDRRSA